VLAFSTVADAGWVILYYCQFFDNTDRGSAISPRVHYNNANDGYKDLSSFDAESGIKAPLFAFRHFCGDDGSCANLDAFGTASLHISLDGRDVALGTPDTSYNHKEDVAKRICDKSGLGNYYDLGLKVNTWNHVPKMKCK
jgi:hypothetical protein